MLARPVTVGVTALTNVLASQRLGRPHPVIESEPVFLAEDELRAADAQALAEFRAAGLLDRRDRLDPDLLDTLTVLGRPSVEYFGWYNDHGSRDIGIAVTALGEEGATVVRVGDRVRIAGIRNRALPEALVALLPEAAPARIDSVNLRLARPRTADGGPDEVLRTARPHVAQDLRTVRRLLAQEAVGVGELYVAVRDERGRRLVRPEPIRYRDTARGRVLVTVSAGYLSVAPATPKLLAERLRGAGQELTG